MKRPALTAERFVEHPWAQTDPSGRGVVYRTGDRVRWTADGELEFGGRFDSQVKLRGQRIELGEIEQVLRVQPGVREAVVLLRTDLSEPTLIAYVSPASVGGATDSERCNALPFDRVPALHGARNVLPAYMLPSFVVGVKEWPRTSTDKINRNGLAKPTWLVESELGSTEPTEHSCVERVERPMSSHRKLLQERILKRMSAELGLTSSSLTLDVPFFDLGMNSLTIVLLMRSLSEELGTQVRYHR